MSKLRWGLVAGAVLAAAGLAVTAFGAPAAAPAAGVTMASPVGMTLREIIKAGGWLMYVLGAISIVMVAFVVYFSIVLRLGQVAPRPLYRDLIEKIRAGSLDDARRACEYTPCPLSAVAMAALDFVRVSPDAEGTVLKDVIMGEGQRQADSIHGQTQYLNDIAGIAPMVGFLGTVVGMLKAFSAVALDIAKAKPMVLAGGVAQALITTVFGLIIAIPALAFYAYFSRRAASMVTELEIAATDIMATLMNRSPR